MVILIIFFRFSWKKNEYVVPIIIIIKWLVDTLDKEIYDSIVRMELLLGAYKFYKLFSTIARYINLSWQKFSMLSLNVSKDMSDNRVEEYFFKKIVLVHPKKEIDKFSLLAYITRKLCLVAGDCVIDNQTL